MSGSHRYKVVVSDIHGRELEEHYFDNKGDAEAVYGSLKKNPNVYQVQFFDTDVYWTQKKVVIH